MRKGKRSHLGFGENIVLELFENLFSVEPKCKVSISLKSEYS